MRKDSLILLYFCFIINIECISEGVYFPKKENIIILTDYSFEEALNEYEYLFVSVYSDICSTCIKKINPSLSLLYKEIQINENELRNIVTIGKIDGSHNHYFMNKYNIMGYPILLLFHKGKIISQLNNKYQIDDMLIFLRKHILRPIQYINNITQYNRLTYNSFKESFITYYGSDIIELNSLINISNTYKHLTFVNIHNISLIKELNASVGDLSINKFFDEPIIVEKKYNDYWGYVEIDKFIKKYNHKLLIEFNSKEGEYYIKNKRNILLLINKQELTKEQIKRMKYMENINIKEVVMNPENKLFHKNFISLAKKVRDKIQSSFILYNKNYINDNNGINKKKRMSLFDEDDPFGFEYQKQENKECEKRQINFVNKMDLDNNINCEIRLIEFKNDKVIFYKLFCDDKNITNNNIDFIEKWYNKSLLPSENQYGIIT